MVIIQFAVDPEALRDSQTEPVLRVSRHKRLFEIWARIGVLVQGGDLVKRSEIINAIEQLPLDLKVLWQKAMQSYRIIDAGPEWQPLSQFNYCEELVILRGKVDVGYFEPSRAIRLGLPLQEPCFYLDSHKIEICRFDVADRSAVIQKALKFCTADIEEGTAVSAVWEQRFQKLSRYCKSSITIIDRYAGSRHLLRRDGLSGLRRILIEISRNPSPISVTLCTSLADGITQLDCCESIRKLVADLPGKGIREFHLFLADDRTFSRISHYRSIRFEKTLCDIDLGLEVFEGNTVFRTSPFKIIGVSDQRKFEEHKLRQASRRFIYSSAGEAHRLSAATYN